MKMLQSYINIIYNKIYTIKAIHIMYNQAELNIDRWDHYRLLYTSRRSLQLHDKSMAEDGLNQL